MLDYVYVRQLFNLSAKRIADFLLFLLEACLIVVKPTTKEPLARAHNRRELTGLTALRLWAALSVLLFHSRFFAEGTLLELPIHAFFSSGWLGVDIFFVLSGFVISYVYSGRLQFAHFVFRRFARIYPAYLLTTVFALLLIAILGRPGYATFGDYDVLMNFLMLQSWYGDWSISVNFVSWSVSAEWAVYLLFPFLIWLVKVLPVNWFGIMFPVGIYALGVGAEWTALGGAITRVIFEFSSGIMLYRFWKRHGEFGQIVAWAALGSLIMALLVPVWAGRMGFHLEECHLAIFAVPIVAWAATWNTNNSIVLFGGRASYSLYLVHGIVYLLLRRLIEIDLLDRFWSLPVFWFLSLGIASLNYVWVEGPARRWLVEKGAGLLRNQRLTRK